MTLDQCYRSNEGQALLIPGGGADNNGQCAQWADTVLHDVYGLPYVYTPAALDWWQNFGSFPQLAANFEQIPAGQPIKAGDFIFYDARVGAPEGHVDVASRDGQLSDFWAYDSNWGGSAYRNADGYPVLHEQHHNDKYNNYIVGYIRFKGGNMPSTADTDTVKRLLLAFWTPDQVAAAGGDNYVQDNVGTETNTLIAALANSPQFLEKRQNEATSVSKQSVLDYVNKNLS